jgi:dimeric dUTPase (all-alpha-NTP-PPase superfamily)
MSDKRVLIAKMTTMLEMQNEMNCRVDNDWIDQNREWYRAIWIECAELMDHFGHWKWWKHSSTDLPQVVLEIVDIWHFGLSLKLTNSKNVGNLAEEIISDWNGQTGDFEFLECVEKIALDALYNREFNAALVRVLLLKCDADFNVLYRNYVGKNVLNLFRQENGYKDGTYEKIWNGEEDNEVLARLMLDMNSDSDSFVREVHEILELNYRAVN